MNETHEIEMQSIKDLINKSDLLVRLYRSSNYLQARFGDEWELEHAIKKMFEEMAEFTLALTVVERNGLVVGDVEKLFSELIDVWVTQFGCLIRLGIRDDTARFYLEHGINFVIDKNDAKTLETHERVRGSIVKRQSKG